MALIDRLKYEALGDDELVWKHWADNLVLGTQVIVNEGQEAVFLKGGRALDVLGPGTHTLSTANLPILQKLINLPFGGKTPFTAEVWFVNRHAKLDMKWGTTEPIQLTDPQYGIIVPVRAWGQFGVRVKDSRLLLTQVVASLKQWNAADVKRYFAGLLTSRLKDVVAKLVVREKVPVLELTAWLDDLSERIRGPVADEMDRWGLEVVNLYVVSVTVPEDDPSVVKLREVLGTRAELLNLGEGYRVKRTFDVLDASAGNPNGLAGTLLAGGIGLGLGLGAGPAVGANLAGAMAPGPATVPGAVSGRYCTSCGLPAAIGARFCSGCGSGLAVAAGSCAQCGVVLPPSAGFCPSCGRKSS